MGPFLGGLAGGGSGCVASTVARPRTEQARNMASLAVRTQQVASYIRCTCSITVYAEYLLWLRKLQRFGCAVCVHKAGDLVRSHGARVSAAVIHRRRRECFHACICIASSEQCKSYDKDSYIFHASAD